VTHRLTRDQARRIVVRAQRLDAERPTDVVGVAEELGAIKIDPTATIAPAEHTILWSRIGASYDPGLLSRAVETDRALFEFDGAFRPTSLLPLLRPGMRRWPAHPRIRAEGPVLASDIPDTAELARANDGWYGSNQVVHMLDCLQQQGEIAVVRRDGRHRVWDLAERVYPARLPEYDDDEAEWMLRRRLLQAAGIARQKSPFTPVGEAGEPAVVEGSGHRYRVDPEAVAALDDDPGGRVAFLNPYDGMLFDRPRLRELFEFDYVLEQFKPKPQRRFGFFAHPILMGDRFVGMLEAEVDRKRELLTVAAVHELLPFDPEEHEMVRAEISDLAEWLGVEVAEG
jgi:uncharacterized protein YcaQ